MKPSIISSFIDLRFEHKSNLKQEMKQKITLIAALFSVTFSFGQTNVNWKGQLSNTTNWVSLFDIENDGNGNLYSTGYADEQTDLNPNINEINLEGSSSGRHIYINKFSPNSFSWGVTLNGEPSSATRGESITIDNQGNVYVTGGYSGTIDFDPSPNVTNESTATEASGYNFDPFLIKLDAQGNLVWYKVWQGNMYNFAVDVDQNGNVFISGYHNGEVDMDPSSNINLENTLSNNYNNSFIIKLDANGDFIWSKSFDSYGSSFAWIRDLRIDSQGNIITTGKYRSFNIDFDNNPLTDENISQNGDYQVFIAKFDNDGNYIWSQTFGGSGIDDVFKLDLDSQDNIVVAGSFQNTVDFDPSVNVNEITASDSYDGFLAKYDNDGNFEWVYTIEGTSAQQVRDISILSTGEIWAAGILNGETNVNPNGTAINYSTAGGRDIFAVKIDEDGNYVESFKIGNSQSEQIYSISHFDDELILTGDFKGELNLDILGGTNPLTAEGQGDVFIAKYGTSCTPAYSTFTTSACDSYTWYDGNTYTTNNNSATYVISGGAANGCDSILTLDLTIETIGDIGVTINGNVLTANENNATYLWLDCGTGNPANGTNNMQSYTPTTNGNYSVVITKGNCEETSQCNSIQTLGINEQQEINNMFTISPNPAQNSIVIKTNQIATISISNAVGEIVLVTETNKVIDISSFNTGVYFVKNNTSNEIKKLIKQ